MALDIITSIELDMKAPNTVRVYGSQYDSAGHVKAQLLNAGEKWSVPSGAKAVVAFQKSDNVGGYYDTTSLGESAVSISSDRSIVTIALDGQTMTTAGRVYIQITFVQNNQRLSTFSFIFQVQASTIVQSNIQSKWFVNLLALSGIVVDDTLSMAGYAADAQSTGNAIEALTGEVESEVERATTEENKKVNKPITNPNGTSGQLLCTNGDGTTEWTNAGTPSDAQVGVAVEAWLNAHPEATTTVEDHTLTLQKFVNGTLGYITPEMFGAVGDGETDDTQAFTALANFINSGSAYIAVFERKQYYLSNSIEITKDCLIYGNGATLIFDGDYGLFISGTDTQIGRIINDASIGDSELTVSFGINPSNNSHPFILYNPVDGSWSSERDYYRQGEFFFLGKAASRQLSLKNPLYDTYPANCEIYEVFPVTALIYNLNFISINSSSTHESLLKIVFGINCIVENCNFFGSPHLQLAYSSCVNSKISNCYGMSVDVETGGTNYGCGVFASQDIIVQNSTFISKRHGFCIGLAYPSIVSRNILFENCYSKAADPSNGSLGFDAHGDSEFVTWRNCVGDGISCQASNATIDGCTFSSGELYPIYSSYVVRGYLKIINSKIYGGGDDGAIRFVNGQYQNGFINSFSLIIDNSYFEKKILYNFAARNTDDNKSYAAIKNSVFDEVVDIRYLTADCIASGCTFNGGLYFRYAYGIKILCTQNFSKNTIQFNGFTAYKVNVMCSENIFDILALNVPVIMSEHSDKTLFNNNVIKLALSGNASGLIGAIDSVALIVTNTIADVILNGYRFTIGVIDNRNSSSGNLVQGNNIIKLDGVVQS